MTCPWCSYRKDELTLREYKHWFLVLAESQHLLGWCHAVLKRHVEQEEELEKEELLELQQVVSDWKGILRKAFNPDWYNEAHYGNIDRHFHVHLIPRYKESRTFEKRKFTDTEYGKMPKHEWHPEQRSYLKKLTRHLQLTR